MKEVTMVSEVWCGEENPVYEHLQAAGFNFDDFFAEELDASLEGCDGDESDLEIRLCEDGHLTLTRRIVVGRGSDDD